jgi:hypothetical protein
MTGAFLGNPIPTLILEGKWDLTWNTDKPEKLLRDELLADPIRRGKAQDAVRACGEPPEGLSGRDGLLVGGFERLNGGR